METNALDPWGLFRCVNWHQFSRDLQGIDSKEQFELANYRFVKLSKLRSWTGWKRYQDLAIEEFEYSKGDLLDSQRHHYFISHRWLTASHPDPDGTQLERVKRLQDDDAMLFYDYCSLPQGDRDPTEQLLFDASLAKLNSLLPRMKVIILNDADYKTRSWCLMEYFISACNGSLICDEVQDLHLAKLQSLATTVMKDATPATFEAGRAARMGEIAFWFFRLFRESKVTNGTDRVKIEDIFRAFIKEHIKVYIFNPLALAYTPRSLTKEEVERVLQGEEIELIGSPSKPEFKEADDCVKIPSSLNEDLENYWQGTLIKRIIIKFWRFNALYDASAEIILKGKIPNSRL